MKVMKRNGTEVIFDITKIIAAITKANNTIEEDARMTPVQIQRIAESVELSCQKMNRSPSVEEIQDLVESQIMAHGAYEVAKNLGTRFFFTERVNGKMTFKRGFHIEPGTRVLIVEDIVTTGGSVREVLDVVKSEGGVPVGVGLLVDRSGGKVDFGVRTEPLLRLDVEAYKPEECPLCQKGVPLTQRGRTGK